jgi:hypothetical protein
MQNPTYPYRATSPGGLGKLLFQRRGALFHALMACLVYWPVCLLTAVGLALVFRNKGIANVPPGVSFFGVAMCLGMGTLGYFGLAQYSLLRVHEGGVSRRAFGRTRCLLYEEIDGFWFGGGHVYAGGAYLGPSYSLAFYPAPGSAKRPVFVELPSFRFTARQAYSDHELESFRDWMYQMLSERMWERLQAGQPVNWTRHLRFLPEGLEYRPQKASGEREGVYPYAAIRRAELDLLAGKMTICVGADSEPFIAERMVRQPNDVPGLMLLDRLRRAGNCAR